MTSSIETKLKTKLFLSRFRHKQNIRKTKEKFIVMTEYGLVEGVKRISVWRKPFYSFEKVPFAKPPVGLLRFRLHPDKLLPVVAWIHGGGFETGSTRKAKYAPDYFMEKDIVLVLIAYRLNIFGFLSLKDPVFGIPGNAGLRDQIMALKWIKNNIAAFGGNPHNVTALGHSAGAASINFLLLSDQAVGLFHKAILMSGSAYCCWALQPPGNEWTNRLMYHMGYKKQLEECTILELLEHADPYDLVSKLSRNLETNELRNKLFLPVGPVIEPYTGIHCVIPKDPRLMAPNAWGNHIPVIVGGNSFEGLIMYPALKKNSSEFEQLGDCTHLVPAELELDPNSNECKRFGRLIRNTYFGKSTPSLVCFLNLLSHKMFWHGIARFYFSRMKYAHQPTYFYRFDFESLTYDNHRILHFEGDIRGVSHCDILPYIFYNAMVEDITPDRPEFKMVRIMISMSTQFAATGNPNNQEWFPLHWKPGVNKPNARIICLNLSNQLSLIDFPENSCIQVWESMLSAKKPI
ncbi:esterase B1-like isoform X4 [Hermetia illucens]|uniref:esterase B1-like isoform X4 n=1 Tax=Hermetia illucens TaxID=343691 RepID=UPI0018CBF6DD|nr:esterase B1-like isoform X4 [Hermetia illucens]